MNVIATDAKNRLGQMLEHCQREPVVIEKPGRRHSVLISAAQHDALVAPRKKRPGKPVDQGQAFYEKYKDWVDMHNDLVERHGIFGEEYRAW